MPTAQVPNELTIVACSILTGTERGRWLALPQQGPNPPQVSYPHANMGAGARKGPLRGHHGVGQGQGPKRYHRHPRG